MPRPVREPNDDTGSDSFLDVVTNIVGILIILVMVIGARVRQVKLGDVAPTPDVTALEEEVRSIARTVASTEGEIESLQEQTRTVATAVSLAADERVGLATAV